MLKSLTRTILLFSVPTCLLFVTADNAFAYLDPGSGSMIVQAVLAGIAAVSVSIGIFWQRIKAFFSRKNPMEDDPNDN